MNPILVAIGFLLIGEFMVVAGASIAIVTMYFSARRCITLETLFGIGAMLFGLFLVTWVCFVRTPV